MSKSKKILLGMSVASIGIGSLCIPLTTLSFNKQEVTNKFNFNEQNNELNSSQMNGSLNNESQPIVGGLSSSQQIVIGTNESSQINGEIDNSSQQINSESNESLKNIITWVDEVDDEMDSSTAWLRLRLIKVRDALNNKIIEDAKTIKTADDFKNLYTKYFTLWGKNSLGNNDYELEIPNNTFIDGINVSGLKLKRRIELSNPYLVSTPEACNYFVVKFDISYGNGSDKILYRTNEFRIENPNPIKIDNDIKNIELKDQNGLVIKNGVIIRYEGSSREIHIPDKVKAKDQNGKEYVVDIKSIADCVFMGKQIRDLTIESTTLEMIGNFAFENNSIMLLDFSKATKLVQIGNNAFKSNWIKQITSWGNVKVLGTSAFEDNTINNYGLNLGKSSIVAIGIKCFASNYLTYNVFNHVLNAIIELPVSLKTVGFLAFGTSKTQNSMRELINNWNLLSDYFTQNTSNWLFYRNIEVITDTYKTEKFDQKIDFTSYLIRGYTIEKDYEYKVRNGIVVKNGVVIRYEGNRPEIDLSGDIITKDSKNRTVKIVITEIADNAFRYSRVRISKLALPESIEKIGRSAFEGNRLSYVDFSKTDLYIIGASAFKDNNIKTIKWGENVQEVGNLAFYNCALTNDGLNLDQSQIIKIGVAAFARNNISFNAYETTPSKFIKLPKTLRVIAYAAFCPMENFVWNIQPNVVIFEQKPNGADFYKNILVGTPSGKLVKYTNLLSFNKALLEFN
ncbi:MAG: leucine-rich repeat protein [Mycoplasma sp.]|nr:leucine-rich repeat protein [Mycoplasma sp.]